MFQNIKLFKQRVDQIVLIKIEMMLLKSIARLPISPTLSLAPMRLFFFSTSGSSSAPFETASINLGNAQSEASSDQKATTKPARSKKKLSHQAQSAIWAERVIHYILNAKPLTNIHSLSLREQILMLQNPDSLHQFEAEPKEKVMRLFTQGVPLNGQVFNQDRVRSAKQTFLEARTNKQNFIFCPNLLVTKQIFNIMMEFQSNFLITGGFGISKTVSIILFIQLSNHVNSYLFEAAQPQHKDTMEELFYLQNVQVNPFFFDQDTKDKQVEDPTLKLPEQEKYFSTTIPRYWYWSIRPERLLVEQLLRLNLLIQAPQISKQKKNELKSIKDFQQFVRQLRRCYPSYQSYCMKIVVDQFNSVAFLARQWNKKVDQYKKMPKENIKKEEYDEYEKDYKLRAKELIRLLTNVIYLSNLPQPSYILNSSMSIQRELLDNRKGKLPQKVYFNIQNEHGDFKIKEIQYFQGLKGSFIDFLHKFWFEIQRKLKIQNNDNTAIKEMKKQFLEEVKEKQVNYFSRFLFVREFLTENKIQQIYEKYEQFKKGQKGDKEQNPFKGIYESFTKENKIKYKQKVRRYFLKDRTNQTLVLLYALYDIAAIQSNTNDKDEELTANLKDLGRRIINNPLELLNLDIYKEILPFTFTEDNESIKFYWKPQQFTSTIREILFEIQGVQAFTPHVLLGYKHYCSYRGIFFEHCVIQSLKKGADVIFRTLKNPTLKELRFIIGQDRFTTFQSFNSSYIGNYDYKIVLKAQAQANKKMYNEKNKLNQKAANEYILSQKNPKDLNLYDVYRIGTSTISKNLSGLLDSCKKYPDQFFIATPAHHQDFDPRSECIDFIIAKKQRFQYQIFTFDVSISRTTAKLSDAKNFFAQILQRENEGRNYKINHIVLCHSDAERPVSYDPNKQVNIFYSPWKAMTFISTKNPPALKAFQRMTKINNLIFDTEE